MSQTKNLLNLFRERDHRLYLAEIRDNWRIVGLKYTNRISELRAMGYKVTCHKDKRYPAGVLYTLLESNGIQ